MRFIITKYSFRYARSYDVLIGDSSDKFTIQIVKKYRLLMPIYHSIKDMCSPLFQSHDELYPSGETFNHSTCNLCSPV